MRKIFILFLFISQVHAQQIVELKKFKPFEQINDTLYFNKNGYDIVKVAEPIYPKSDTLKKPKRYDIFFYILRNDHADASDLKNLSKDLEYSLRSSPEFKKNKSYYYGNISSQSSLYEKIRITSKRPDWHIEMKHDSLETSLPINYLTEDVVNLPISRFRKLGKTLDSISSLLNYSEGQEYSIFISHNKTAEVQITPSNECTNYTETKIPKKSLHDIEVSLEKWRWPTFKIDGTIYPYKLNTSTSYAGVSSLKLGNELDNGFSNSIQVFENNKNLWALIDSFNNRSVVYLVGLKDSELTIVKRETRKGLLNMNRADQWDINNDGYNDLIIDSIELTNETEIYFFPNYPLATAYSYDLTDKLVFKTSLNNNYYYSVSSSSNESVSLFLVNQGIRKEIIGYAKLPLYKRRLSHLRRRRNELKGYRFYTFVLNTPQLSIKTKNPKKAYMVKQKIMDLLVDYLDHPEKLPIDFPTKKTH